MDLEDHLAKVVGRSSLPFLELEQERIVNVLFIVRIVLLFVQMLFPHFHVVVVDNHALEMKFGHVDKLVERVLTIWRKYETSSTRNERNKNWSNECSVTGQLLLMSACLPGGHYYSPFVLEQFVNGDTQVLAKLVKEETERHQKTKKVHQMTPNCLAQLANGGYSPVRADDVVEAVFEVAIIGLLVPLKQTAFHATLELVFVTNHLQILRFRQQKANISSSFPHVRSQTHALNLKPCVLMNV